ncbi:Os08g0223200 [Oryza sativa Japonica Group]|uniref:Os08g0223200 protein n=1 Tax=Oryza sativa subsp. japonica TaxID=39947 RepID=A0A0P0XDM8_ORYSJ|nr:Os08g0223200 [Oryza sativa Japonica Group]
MVIGHARMPRCPILTATPLSPRGRRGQHRTITLLLLAHARGNRPPTQRSPQRFRGDHVVNTAIHDAPPEGLRNCHLVTREALMSTASCAIVNAWLVTAATVGIGSATRSATSPEGHRLWRRAARRARAHPGRPKPLEKHFSLVAITGALAPTVAQT